MFSAVLWKPPGHWVLKFVGFNLWGSTVLFGAWRAGGVVQGCMSLRRHMSKAQTLIDLDTLQSMLRVIRLRTFSYPLRTRFVTQPLLEELLWESIRFHRIDRNPGLAVTQLTRARFSGMSTHPTRMRVTITEPVQPQPLQGLQEVG